MRTMKQEMKNVKLVKETRHRKVDRRTGRTYILIKRRAYARV